MADQDIAAPETAVGGLDPFAPGFYENPYAQYEALRDHDPVHHSVFGSWMVTRWDDVHALLRKPGTSVEDRNVTSIDETRREQMAKLVEGREVRRSRAILNIDPPDHTRLRKLVSKAFTPRAVERIRTQAGELVDEILEDLATREGPVDLVSELAFPLPFTVISEMLGMPEGDRDQLRAWSHTITQVLDPILAMQHAEAIFDASDRMREVVAEAIAWKRTRDDDDLLAAMIAAEEHGDVLSDIELVDNVVLLYLAGHETTVNLIGNGTAALLRHRDQLDRLVADPSLDANAIEELLRWDSPVQFSRRIAMEPIEVAGHAIGPGEFVTTVLGSANRDPRKFGPTAGELDLARPDAREHVSFGSGVHHCLGAALARLEGQEAIGRLVRRFPAMELAGDPVQNGRIVLRGLDELPVSLAG
ncbi:cytochrome P450 [Aquihabitans sp. G128]|uniref:cytochrome P450 n=1 Tax=Aquihabitans sp. G128 TaxID=2849779 RepID=UPI001C216D6A|nr:cytochrome P450 [Aquihabitans sp. G128]QXC62782.1 cytochrome P450 [Aquihabitans sp. G128]